LKSLSNSKKPEQRYEERKEESELCSDFGQYDLDAIEEPVRGNYEKQPQPQPVKFMSYESIVESKPLPNQIGLLP
jgi:hypothetical protein